MIDYEKKYNEALERAQKVTRAGGDVAMVIVQDIFPELAEGEDERIRKFLLDYAIEMIAGLESDISRSTYNGIKGHDPESEAELAQWQKARAYLEKQKKPNARQRLAEWSKTEEGKAKYEEVAKEMREEMQKEQKPADRFEEAREKYQVEWSEEDEKIRKELIGMVKFHCADEHLGRYLNWLENRVKFLRPQPKQEWSGRDEEILEFVLGLLDNLVWRKDWEISQAECLEWLVKSLNPTKQEWNEEDERIRKAILGFLNPDKGGTKYSSYAELVKWSDWLKSLRPSWKPSEEQMDSLRDTIVQTKGYSYSMYLPELYEQLKKLM